VSIDINILKERCRTSLNRSRSGQCDSGPFRTALVSKQNDQTAFLALVALGDWPTEVVDIIKRSWRIESPTFAPQLVDVLLSLLKMSQRIGIRPLSGLPLLPLRWKGKNVRRMPQRFATSALNADDSEM
jgi:hypothetical protein